MEATKLISFKGKICLPCLPLEKIPRMLVSHVSLVSQEERGKEAGDEGGEQVDTDRARRST